MKIYRIVITIAALTMISCSDSFLDFTPNGIVTSSQLSAGGATVADQLVISAYATLANTAWSVPIASNWLWGSVRSDDAYKGGNGPTDQGGMHTLETFYLLDPNVAGGTSFATGWTASYQALTRVNIALRALNDLTNEQMSTRQVRIAEMRFLRGHYNFLLKRLYKYFPYIDETIPQQDIIKVSNRQFTNEELWDKIAADFQFAYDNLPTTQPQLARANKYAAAAYLAKAKLYQAYVQDEQHNVTNINQAKLQEAVTLFDVVINSGRYALNDNFGKNFTFGYENSPESVFAIQFSQSDGTPNGKIATEYGLNYNMAPQYGCCGFHVPSANLVNSFKTGLDGLPLFTTFNDETIQNPLEFKGPNTFDPRLDHTVGIPTHPFKYNQTFIAANSWVRNAGVYGTYATMKEIQLPTCSCLIKVGAFFGTSQNIDVIRYDDVLLMKAEALIELGQHSLALPLINEIRTRANSETTKAWVTWSSGSNAGQGFSNYNIATYTSFPNQEYARQALRFERRLEFAMESPRFFDLVRWGIASETMNAYFTKEKTRRGFLNPAVFVDGRDEYLPIPEPQINLSLGLYQQNNGW
jgi:starch-binding outer membrane protein, SusD/RagB family